MKNRARRKQRKSHQARQVAVPIERARALLDGGDAQKAAQIAQRLCVSHGRVAAVQLLAGDVALAAGDAPGALSIFERWVTREPDSAVAQIGVARACHELRLLDRLEAALRSAGRAGDDSMLLAGAIEYEWSRYYVLRHDAVAALRCARDAVACQPMSVPYQLHLAQCLLTDGEHRAANEILRPLLDRRECSGRQWLEIGEVAEAAGDTGSARLAWRNAHQVAPELKTHASNRGCTAYTAGQFATAARWFREAVCLDPNDRVAINNLIGALVRVRPGVADAQVSQALAHCLHRDGVDPNHLRTLAAHVVLSNPGLRRWQPPAAGAAP